MDASITPLFPVFSDNFGDHHYSHLLRELERIDLCLQYYANQHRERLESHVLEGFLLDETEIHLHSAMPSGAPHWMKGKEEPREHTLFQGTCSGDGLMQLVEQFELTAFEVDILLLGMLPYVESRYLSLFAALQRSSHKNFPSFELALALFGQASLPDSTARLSLLPQSPLLKYQLITLEKTGEKQGEGWGQSLYQTAIGVCQYLTGNRYFSPPLLACTQWYPMALNVDLYCPEPILAALQVQSEGYDDNVYPVLMLEGTYESGRLEAIRAAAAQLNCPVLMLDMAKLPRDHVAALQTLGEAMREVRMREAVLVLRQQEEQEEEPQESAIDWTGHLLQPGLRVVILCERQAGHMLIPGVPQLVVELTGLSRTEKEQLLSQSLNGDFEPNLDIVSFCRRFSFTRETLPLILQEAKSYQRLRNASDTVCASDLNKAFGLHARKNFGRLAQRKEPKRTFDDLVVADELKVQLSEILMAAKHRDTVLEQGFASKVGYGTGVSALFCGHSGTGKTMAAEVIAGQLGVDLIKVDLSTVVNKYIGETEKNLSRIFDLAEADAGVLFFDEADALFGKRSAVTDSKDRHANIEVAYLLQRLENHPGLVILATNNRNHLDDAFSRRFTFITRFNFPDATLREQMWRRIWPAKVALSPRINFTELAKNAELTGANIRNIALMSAWLAADEHQPHICEQHIRLAMRRELEKVGRLSL